VIFFSAEGIDCHFSGAEPREGLVTIFSDANSVSDSLRCRVTSTQQISRTAYAIVGRMEVGVESMPSPTEDSRAKSRVICGTYFADDGKGDNVKGNGDIFGDVSLSQSVREMKFSSKIRKKLLKRHHRRRKSVSVGRGTDNSSNGRPVNLMCPQFPSDSHSESIGVVTVGVSCGAMNPFSTNDLPYNSAGLMLTASPRSVDSNSVGVLSESSRRRRRKTVSSPNSSHASKNARTSSQKNFQRSNSRRGSERVESFNYAKALLRSDRELAKLSRKIRLEIYESELYELAEAAERAAESGVDNFSGKPSTFGGQQEKKRLANTGPQIPGATEPKSTTGEKGTATSSTSSKIYSPGYVRPMQSHAHNEDHGEVRDRGRSSAGFSEQSLLDQARAAAAAVVVGAPAIKLSTLAQTQKDPERRSMPISSLRDVNEVIPQWKELHGHMRTHLCRQGVNKESMVFCETSSSNLASKKTKDSVPGSTDPKNRSDVVSNRRSKSFFENIASMKILPKFRSIKESRKKNFQRDDGTSSGDRPKNKSCERNEMPTGEMAGTSLSNLPAENKDHRSPQSPHLSTRSGVVDGKSQTQDHAVDSKLENESDHHSLLTPRPQKRPDIFGVDVLDDSNGLGTSPLLPETTSPNFITRVIGSSDNSLLGSPKEGRSVVGSPQINGTLASELVEEKSKYPTSPLGSQERAYDFHSRSTKPTSHSAPSTPKNSVVPRRKEFGFSTPAHLRIIKRLHRSVSAEKMLRSVHSFEQSKSEDLHPLEHREESCLSTPGAPTYCELEPNSIVEIPTQLPSNVMEKPSLKEIEAKQLSLPIIQSAKSESDLHKPSRIFFRRTLRNQWQHGAKSSVESSIKPTSTDSPSKIFSSEGKEFRDSSSTADLVSESSTDQSEDDDSVSFADDTKSSPSKNSPQHLARSMPRTKQSHAFFSRGDNLVRSSQYTEAIDEKKECDSTTISSKPTSTYEKGENTLFDTRNFSLDLFPIRDDGKEGDNDPVQWRTSSKNYQKNVFLEPETDDASSSGASLSENDQVSELSNRASEWESMPLTKYSKQNSMGVGTVSDSNFVAEPSGNMSTNHSVHGDDGWIRRYNLRDPNSDDDNLSGCHSLPPTDANFKAAVQTVQSVFSQLSLGSPRSPVVTDDWRSEADNKEFLSNYFYCAKPEKVTALERSSTNAVTGEAFDSSVNFGERLGCTEPCNGRESPCFMFGIDAMCGGLADLLPNEVKASSVTKTQRRRSNDAIPSRLTARDRSSSISMGRIHQHGQDLRSSVHSNRHEETSSWVSMFQQAASERFHFQFQTEENEVEKSKRPFTPPCLSRKVLLTRSHSR